MGNVATNRAFDSAVELLINDDAEGYLLLMREEQKIREMLNLINENVHKNVSLIQVDLPDVFA
jgi:hypothetical protein